MENLIKHETNCGAFVYRDEAGIHVGDCDNHHTFETIGAAMRHCKMARLGGGRLSHARRMLRDDPHGNAAAEYRWHQDAGAQIDALRRMAV